MSRDEKTRGTSRPSLPRRLSFARRGFTSFELVLTLTLIGLVLALGVFRGHLDVLAAVQEKTDQCSGPAPREMWW